MDIHMRYDLITYYEISNMLVAQLNPSPITVTVRFNHTMSKYGRRIKEPPADYEIIQGTLDALDAEIREKVNEPHEGLRKNESQWPVHQINWQKSRYM